MQLSFPDKPMSPAFSKVRLCTRFSLLPTCAFSGGQKDCPPFFSHIEAFEMQHNTAEATWKNRNELREFILALALCAVLFLTVL